VYISGIPLFSRITKSVSPMSKLPRCAERHYHVWLYIPSVTVDLLPLHQSPPFRMYPSRTPTSSGCLISSHKTIDALSSRWSLGSLDVWQNLNRRSMDAWHRIPIAFHFTPWLIVQPSLSTSASFYCLRWMMLGQKHIWATCPNLLVGGLRAELLLKAIG
jgi:hypothetical protein